MRYRLALALVLGLAACHSSSDDGGGAGPTSNFGLAAISIEGKGALWALSVSELEQGQTDLNGDGDADSDPVLFLYHDGDPAPQNLGFAVGAVEVGDGLVAFGVTEFLQDDTDLNGDGDNGDSVLFVYDDSDGTVTNTGLALGSIGPVIGAGSVAFTVSEASQGATDLDGNGNTDGRVLHVYDSRTRLATNAQRAVTSSFVFHDQAFAFTTDEGAAGADLNGDGDTEDERIFEVYDLVVGGVVGVPLAIVNDWPLAIGVDDWIVLADEAQEGADLDGDGDLADGVYHRVQPQLGTIETLGLASLQTHLCAVDGTQVALSVQEIDGIDRNDDGDLEDTTVFLYDTTGGETFESARAIVPNADLEFVGETALAFSVPEFDQGLDLNGDGDLFDRILHVMDRVSGMVSNLGVPQSLSIAGARVFLRHELEEGQDINGDGDATDEVVFYLDPATLEVRGTGLVGAFVPFTEDPETLVVLFGDSLLALRYVLYDYASGTSLDLGLAAEGPFAWLNADGHGLLLAFEFVQQRDLNGDGDLGDSVVHAFRTR